RGQRGVQRAGVARREAGAHGQVVRDARGGRLDRVVVGGSLEVVVVEDRVVVGRVLVGRPGRAVVDEVARVDHRLEVGVPGAPARAQLVEDVVDPLVATDGEVV